MTVRDHSKLPKAKKGTKPGIRPDVPNFTKHLTREWLAERRTQKQRPTVIEGQPWRPSKSGSCTAEMWFTANGYVPEPPDGVANWSFEMGQWVHDWLDKWMTHTYPIVELEYQYDITHRGMHFGGNIDAYLNPPGGESVAFEFKSINGLGYQNAVLSSQGPRDSALLQAAVNGHGVDADWVVVVYASLQVVSAVQAKRRNVQHPDQQRFIAEWSYPREVYEPLAVAELDRVVDAITAEVPVRRPVGIPVMAEITNPATGQWTEHTDGGAAFGNAWNCGYCGHQATCIDHLKTGGPST